MKNKTNVSFISSNELNKSALQLAQLSMVETQLRDWHQQILIDSIRQGIESNIYAGRKKYTVLIVEEE